MANSSELRATAAAAAARARARADELHAASTQASHDAARAAALLDLFELRVECDRTVAERLATLATEVATTRAALRVERLQEARVAKLEKQVAELKIELGETRQSLADASGRCGDLENALQQQRRSHVEEDTSPLSQMSILIWQRALTFCGIRDFCALSTVCTTFRLEAQNDGLWEMVCRRKYPAHVLKRCTNFRAAIVSEICSRQVDEIKRQEALLERQDNLLFRQASELLSLQAKVELQERQLLLWEAHARLTTSARS